MRKIGLIVDSASGLSMKEANDRGIAMIPLQIIIDGEIKKAGVDILQDELLSKMEENKKDIELKTSLPNGTDIEAAFEWILERCEKAIYISVSHRMSGTLNAVRTVTNLDEKYKERIYCYESEYSSPWLRAYIDEFEHIIEKYDDFEEIAKILDLANPYIYGHISPGDILWFYKGGRISKMQYVAGSLLKVKPILTIEDGDLAKEKIDKARGVEKAMNKMVEMVEEQAEKLKKEGLAYKIMTINSSEPEYTEIMIGKIIERFGVEEKDIIIHPVSTEQSAHMGPGAFGLAAFVELKELMRKNGIDY